MMTNMENVSNVPLIETRGLKKFFKVRGGQNALAFTTEYYQPIPLVVSGYGAGTDVTAAATGSWSANSVDFAYDSHLINGTGDKVFSPDATMTRAMLVTVLYRAAGSPAVAVNTAFTDLDTKGYYYNAVVWANALGVVSGTSATTLSPEAPATRAQVVVMLHRYLAS